MDHDLKGYQRAELFRQAHHLTPVVTVGKEGASEALMEHLDRELMNHELIKIRFTDFKANRHGMAAQMAAQSGAYLVGVIGHIAILYRMHPEPGKRRVHYPEK